MVEIEALLRVALRPTQVSFDALRDGSHERRKIDRVIRSRPWSNFPAER